MSDVVIGLDIGGTKIQGAAIDARGKILSRHREEVAVSRGPEAFFKQITDFVNKLSSSGDISRVGIGCAGPLDGNTGELLDPTNFFTDGKSWGKLDLLGPLRKTLPKFKFQLDNDAAAAVLAEQWLGEEKMNLVVMTLGTGVGVGTIVDGALVRTRQGLHPEASHIPLNCSDIRYECGCGNFGCIEAYLSGAHTVRRLAKEWGDPNLNGAGLVDRCKNKDPLALAAMEKYGEWLAQAVHAFAVLYGPKQVRLSGGFSTAAPWFLPTTQKRLPELLARRRAGVDFLPKVEVSKLGDDLGIFGAACVARRSS